MDVDVARRIEHMDPGERQALLRFLDLLPAQDRDSDDRATAAAPPAARPAPSD